ncbi:hypothetical protein QW180_26385 [Vibrio sinaloensis]|nr:hypothetical protein [Vibrio sinaloensis]
MVAIDGFNSYGNYYFCPYIRWITFLPFQGQIKLTIFIAYGALAFPVALARPEKWLLFILGFLVYSGVIELVQPYVNRYGEWLDLGANGLGLFVGIFNCFFLFGRFFLKEKNRYNKAFKADSQRLTFLYSKLG